MVIGSVGLEEKLDFIENRLGFDGGFNYRTEKPEAALKRILGELGKEGIDVYYGNVGGEQLDAALGALIMYGRVGTSLSPFSSTPSQPPFPHNILTTTQSPAAASPKPPSDPKTRTASRTCLSSSASA